MVISLNLELFIKAIHDTQFNPDNTLRSPAVDWKSRGLNYFNNQPGT